MLLESESDVRQRERAAKAAKRALEKARADEQVPTFTPFRIEEGKDAGEEAWEAACEVVWPDDSTLAQAVHAFGSAAAGNGTGQQLSYRFTPRSQRNDTLGARTMGTGVGRRSVGRAKVRAAAAAACMNPHGHRLSVTPPFARSLPPARGARACVEARAALARCAVRGVAFFAERLVLGVLRPFQVLVKVDLGHNPKPYNPYFNQ